MSMYFSPEIAPFHIGATVRVIKVDDQSLIPYIGRIGIITVYYIEDDEDPLIGVKFDNGDNYEFWPEELVEVEITIKEKK